VSFRYRSTGATDAPRDNSVSIQLVIDGVTLNAWTLDPRATRTVEARCTLEGSTLHFRHGSRKRERSLLRPPQYGALMIRSHDTTVGPRPRFELHDLRVNGKPVELYNDVWHDAPTVEEVLALRADVERRKAEVLPR
jgi:hypothetical protein